MAETMNDNKLVSEYRGLTNDGMSEEARAALDPDSEEYFMRLVSASFYFIFFFTFHRKLLDSQESEGSLSYIAPGVA